MDQALAAVAEQWVFPGRDSLDVALHDSDLLEEVELAVLLMVAANESHGPLAQTYVDEILGIAS